MEVQIVSKALHEAETEMLVLTLFEDTLDKLGYLSELDQTLFGKLSRMIESKEIQAKYREFTVLHLDSPGPKRLLIMGLGKEKDFSIDRIRSIAANSARYARRIRISEMAIHDFSEYAVLPQDCSTALIEGVLMGMYRFDKYKSQKKNPEKKLQKIKIIASKTAQIEALRLGAEKGQNLAESTNFARDLVNEPANYLTPVRFAEYAQEVAKNEGLEIQILGPEEIEREGMGAFLAVARGSEQPPRMVVIRYHGNHGGKTLGIVGKGVTFDSGGYDIKPSSGMLRMYGDMAGAAATLGAVRSIAHQKLAVNLVAVMPLAENLISGKAYKPSDILTSMSGKTIEMLNTDAEGRLLLADALTYIQKYHQPDVLIDIATLTGAAVVALGRTVSVALSNDDELYAQFFKAGEYTGERIWRLPLYEEYRSQLISDVADIESVGGSSGGTITAAMFLKEFIEPNQAWLHLDIAGTAMMEEEIARYVKTPYIPKEGGTGTGVRLLYTFAEYFANKV
ncbi:MAG: leucyl aminopeptidase [Candidatus Sericytochromatia bacterium]|nr:leucyl aminopeptidase [Candidatus Sericytochromatia bacterium]